MQALIALGLAPLRPLEEQPQMEEISTGSDSDYSNSWISWFLSSKGNEYFCEVEEEYILDRFNLTGLNTEVSNYNQALDLITDNLDDDIQDELRGALDVQARLLYGLIHARWIVTARGLAKMLEKYKRADFGRCPRVLCQSQPLLPVGLTDVPYEKSVKLYCGRCEDIYSPKSSRHGSIDGAYFGTSFPHLLFLVYPNLIPPKSGPVDVGIRAAEGDGRRRRREEQELPAEGLGEGTSTATAALKAERYRPKIFGFQVHEIAKLQRWQEAIRDRQIGRLEDSFV
ncbi:casein kinase II subunit beta [Phanerochaete sordida]|uniref:Casein kinase II subunit beta n=1 Tax=Phanerochaete sordida TaxID=48140 RepID=A0A9P3L832_9APHY|nr:casein kinase II subunit beta [Phanerochaete sordida]